MTTFQILLATFNGAQFLEEQLASLERQSVGVLNVLASDDGSRDETRAILEKAKAGWSRGAFEIIAGPRGGFAANFRHLVESAPDDADAYAYCDQDDIWDADKLETAWRSFAAADHASTPAVFASSARLIDAQGRPLGRTPARRGGPSIRNAMIQNIAGGNTMVMNRAAFRLLKRTSDRIDPFPHDHWLYLLIAASGGRFDFSERPTISWRQHDGNAVGARTPVLYQPSLSQLRRLRRGKLRGRMGASIGLLDRSRDLLTQEAAEVLAQCRKIHTSPSVVERFHALRRSGLYRTSLSGQFGLWLDFLINFKAMPNADPVLHGRS